MSFRFRGGSNASSGMGVAEHCKGTFLELQRKKAHRYAVYDFDFVTSDNCQKSKIFFIAWSPESSRIRAKMLYATSKGRLRHDLDGVHYEIQATDSTEMELDVLRERVY
ncbi:unnamed protein product [Lactuca virosa]|uniref:ADF-H domain-containing protein n=1 Tax=Lactuca virosa TaxID=75947 RepID=A0AAU9MXP2_9ASTR|nr:unnamed protein product [Lactuca virosa]